MNLISNINPERIRWCCDQLSMTIADLAVTKSIKEESLNNGSLTYSQLKTVAGYFGYSPLFFLQPETPQTEKIQSPAFRSLTNQSVGMSRQLINIIRRVEQHRDLYLELMDELDEDILPFTPPKLLGNIDEKAQSVREWLGLNYNQRYSYKDYRSILESKGIMVFQSMGYAGKWQLSDNNAVGFSIAHTKTPIIFVKKTSLQMQTFTLFHELGHLLLHEGHCIDDETQLHYDNITQHEREANNFAAKCLLPSNLLPNIVVPPPIFTMRNMVHLRSN